MKKLQIILILILFYNSDIFCQLFPVLGGQRAGISTAQFLKIGVGGRAQALGEAFVAMANDASALYWNPAGLTHLENHQVFFSHTNWVADIQHEYGGIVYKPNSSLALGLSLTALHMEDMKVTTETQPFGTGEYFSYKDFAFGLSFAYQLTDKFSFGGTLKYINESMANIKVNAFLIDMGTFYWTGLGTSRFAVTVSNFGADIQPTGEVTLLNGKKINSFQSFSPPTMFRIGFAVEPYQTEEYRVTTSLQVNHPNDNSENLALGVELGWKEILFLRGGYKLNVDEQTFTFGAGINAPLSFATFNFDYAYGKFERLGSTHRFSIILGIN